MMKSSGDPQTLRLLVCVVAAAIASVALAQGPPVTQAEAALTPAQQSGQAVYDQHCAACHGVKGEGNGPAAVWVYPKPRNFTSGLFKIKSTPPGALPSDDDLFQTVTRGMAGS